MGKSISVSKVLSHRNNTSIKLCKNNIKYIKMIKFVSISNFLKTICGGYFNEKTNVVTF